MRYERLVMVAALFIGCGAPESSAPDDSLVPESVIASQQSPLTTCDGPGMTFEQAFASFHNGQLGTFQFTSPIGNGSGAVRVSRVDKTEYRGGVYHHTRKLDLYLVGSRSGYSSCGGWRVTCRSFVGQDFLCDSTVYYDSTYGGASSECFQFGKTVTMRGLLTDKCFAVSADSGWRASGVF